MNRRSLLSLIGLAPFGAATVAAPPAEAQPRPHVGEIVDCFEAVQHSYQDPGHQHSLYATEVACHQHLCGSAGGIHYTAYQGDQILRRRFIYDGEKFVLFDSSEGAAVMNRITARLALER